MKYLLAFALAPILLLSACEPAIPTEAEVRAHISGSYCFQTAQKTSYQLVLADSTYQMTKSTPSLLGTGLLREYCQGTYSLVFDAGEWRIYYSENKSPRRTTIYDCGGDFPVWNAIDRYIGGPEKRMMKDPFDGQELFAADCEAI